MSRELADSRLREVERRLDDLEVRDEIGYAERAALDEFFRQPIGEEILSWDAGPATHVAAAQVVAGMRSSEEVMSSVGGDADRRALEIRLPILEEQAVAYFSAHEAFEL